LAKYKVNIVTPFPGFCYFFYPIRRQQILSCRATNQSLWRCIFWTKSGLPGYLNVLGRKLQSWMANL